MSYLDDTGTTLPLYGTSETVTIDGYIIARVTNFWAEAGPGWRVVTTDGAVYNTTPDGYSAIEAKFLELRESDPWYQNLVLVEVDIPDDEGRAAFADFVCLRRVIDIRPLDNGKSRITVEGVGDIITSDFAASQLHK